jgi:hypothetical protein
MSIISRITTWAVNQILTSTNLNGEFNNIINTMNNLDSGSTAWDNINTNVLTVNTTATVPNGSTSNNAMAYGQYFYGGQKAVQATYSTPTSTGSGSYQVTGLSASITPTTATARIKISVSIPYQSNALIANSDSDNQMFIDLERNTTLLIETRQGTAFAVATTQNALGTCSFTYIDSPATTSSITYRCRFSRASASTSLCTVQANSETSTIILEEIV